MSEMFCLKQDIIELDFENFVLHKKTIYNKKRRNKMLSKFEVSKMSEEEVFEMVKKFPPSLEYVENQTLKMCLTAVKKDPRVLNWAKNQTLEMCKIAVKGDSDILQYVNREFLRDDLEELDFGDPLGNLKEEEK